MIQRRIHKCLRYHFARLLNTFVEKNIISEEHFIECTKGIMEICKTKLKIAKYKLLDTQKGLYAKEENDYYNPCYVIAGGASLKNFDFKLLENKTTIVSNKSIFDVPNANYFITTDYTFLNHLKKEGQYNEWKNTECMKFFVANCISPSIQINNGEIKDVRYDLTYELQDFDRIVICKSAKDIGYNFDNFNSGYNSGYSSFQLAVILGYNPIYLLGMDMISSNKNTHYHEGYGKSISRMNTNLDNYSKHFLNILEKLKIEKPDLKVISCSSISLLNQVIEYKPIEEIL